MIRGRDFVVLSDDWRGLPTSTMHLFRIIARQNRVFWFNLANRMPQLNLADARKAAQFAVRWGWPFACPTAPSGIGDNNHPQNLHVTTPLMIPWFKAPLRRLNQKSLVRSYERLKKIHKIQNPIHFAVFPSAADFMQVAGSGLKVYYCYDDFLEYPGFNPTDWQAMENDLLDAVDALVVTSRDLEKKNRRSCPMLYLPHGVDLAHFQQARSVPVSVPQMEAMPRPIVGFFGLISQWVDLRLIAALGNLHPDVSFVLLGKSEVDLAPLAHCKNVYHLGFVPYKELPAYAKYFDIAMIPFVKNRLTEAVNPLKLMEYFALGLPVLATRLSELESINGPLRLASTEAEFSSHLQQMLQDKSCWNGNCALEVAQANTWETRVEELSTFLESVSPGCR